MIVLLVIAGCASGPALPLERCNLALARYAQGASLDELSHDLSVDRTEAREAVHRAMLELQRRYYRDR
jgi:DNA-directed RNA polymerase specialized sigma24 family protein